jgi:hypothetical protein
LTYALDRGYTQQNRGDITVDIIEEIAQQSNGDILCIVQAANEMPEHYSIEEKLRAGMEEVTGAPVKI